MSLWSKIFTLFRGTATAVGQAVVDANAIRILDQEIRDASAALVRSREDLTKIMAQRRLVGDGSTQDGGAVVGVREVEAVEPGGPAVVEPAPEADLVPVAVLLVRPAHAGNVGTAVMRARHHR